MSKTTHGLRHSRVYVIWSMMKQRCYNPKHKAYSKYGGAGILVCDEWKNSFARFYKDMGEPPEHNSQLDRIDPSLGYCKDNCRWVSPQQNIFNKRSVSNTTSRYKGVSWSKKANKWKVGITKDSKQYHIGYFEDEKEAAIAYNKVAKELFGEHAYLNNVEGEDEM